ncbi:hypothetical protein RZS08_40575, partial [Arthrospira platensis SPKY1]|nr:hypothetical protein [Arthrospira platensis SPKY1]
VEYGQKGSFVVVYGKMCDNRWVDKKTGEKRSRVVVQASQVELSFSKKAESHNDDDEEVPY